MCMLNDMILVVKELVWNPSWFRLTTGIIWAQVRKFEHFSTCLCTCALIIWSVLLQPPSAMYYEATRRWPSFDQWGFSFWSLRPLSIPSKQLPMVFDLSWHQPTRFIKEVGCSNNAWCSWEEEKDFLPRKCSHLDSLVDKECKPEEKHYIHREVWWGHGTFGYEQWL
jgi:hypothetical protein